MFIAYSWPATPSIWAYASDTETASLSARYFRIFLEYLSEETDAENIHIIGFSAGTRMIVHTLEQMALIHRHQKGAGVRNRHRIGRVILTASDVDRRLFESYLVDGLLNIPEYLSIYLSEKDRALGLSSRLFSHQRLGQMWNKESVKQSTVNYLASLRNLSFINVTDARGAATGDGHVYFRKSPWVSSDILVALKYKLPPETRGLIQTDASPVWTFPTDYIKKLRQALIAADPEIGKVPRNK